MGGQMCAFLDGRTLPTAWRVCLAVVQDSGLYYMIAFASNFSSSSTSSSPSFDQGNVGSLARALADISQNLKVVSDEVEKLKRSKPHS
jgi:hypothetical protein